MKRRIVAFLFVMAFPMMGYSQSTLNFPKLFSAAELPNTGFAIVNPGTAAANVTFTLYGATGGTVSTRTYSGADAIAAGGQFARSGNEIFQPPLGSGGWVEASSTSTGLTGFWINYAGDLSYLDGADGATAVQSGVFPLVAGQTQINVVNLAAAQNEVHFHIHAADGAEVSAAQTKFIAPKGVYSAQVTDLFPGVNMANANYIRAVALGGNIAGTSLVRGYLVPVESAVVNMSDGLTTSTEANFPHMANGLLGALNYSTVVDVVNLAQTAQTVTITFTPDTGTPVSVQRPLPVFGALRETATNLFNLPASYVGGFVRVTGTAPLTGFAAFADSVGGQVAVVPVGTAKTSMLFAHIADGPPSWQTGLAFLNTTSTDANVEIYAFKADGSLYGSRNLTILAGKRRVDIIHDLVAQVNGQNGGFVYVRTTNNVALHGIELFYTQNGNVLSNVAAGSGTLNLSAAPAPTLTSASPTTVARGETLTLAGTGFSTTAASNTVRFTSNTGTVDAAATTATSTGLTVTVPATAISGPVLVVVNGQASGSVLLTVTATATTLIQSSINLAAGTTVSNLDIYVPTNAAPANVTQIGLSDAGSGSVEFGGQSQEITRGQTKDLWIILTAGTTLTQVNGTNVTVTGTDLTLTNTRFDTLSGGVPVIRVQIQAAVAAATGPRNIVLANNGLDTTVFSGGLIVK